MCPLGDVAGDDYADVDNAAAFTHGVHQQAKVALAVALKIATASVKQAVPSKLQDVPGKSWKPEPGAAFCNVEDQRQPLGSSGSLEMKT